MWLENFIAGAEDKLIILLEIKIPGIDGFAFVEEFEKLDKNNSSQILIFLLYSEGDPDDNKGARKNVYVKTLLSKPLPTEEFSSLLVAQFIIAN